MIYQLIVKYHGYTFIKAPFKLVIDPYTLIVECDNNNMVDKLIIQRKITDYKEYIPKLKTIEPHKHSLTIPESPYYNDIMSLLQTVESFGHFWFKVKKIDWGFPKREWIPENDEEKKQIRVLNINFTKEYDKTPIEMTPEILSGIITSLDKLNYLIIPMAFVREGRNDYESFRYINAFFNFYFYLEDLYGKGKTKNDLVEKEFMKSTYIKYALDKTISTFSKRHTDNLKKFLEIENFKFDNEGIIKLIVKVRGNLHHFSQKSSKLKGHPFNQNDFETMAYLLMCLCIHTFTILATGVAPK